MRARSALAEARINPKDDKLVEAFGAIHNRLGTGLHPPQPRRKGGRVAASRLVLLANPYDPGGGCAGGRGLNTALVCGKAMMPAFALMDRCTPT